jgi:two-component SAPR family response regulator
LARFLKNIVPLIVFYFCSISLLTAQEVKYGLEFNSFEEVKEKRTGLNLNLIEPNSFSEGFSLSFDVAFKSKTKYSFGYVFRIIGQNEQHIDFLLNDTNLIVTYSLGKAIATCSFREINSSFDEYLPFKITLDTKDNQLNITLGTATFSSKAVSMKDFKKANIIFGKCDYPQHQTSDIPKMTIKNIRINNDKEEPVYFWPLSKHTQTGVYDELKNHFASVENPQWVLDNHALWVKQITFNTQTNPQIAYNPDENSIAIADISHFFIYDTHTRTLKKDKLEKGVPHSIFSNQILYSPWDQQFYSYYFDLGTGQDMAVYDASTKTWNNDALEETYTDYWHHNKTASISDSSLYFFGGYGHHKYKNSINKYHFNTQTWEKLHYEGDQIQPRYLSGLGVMDENQVLIFGGYGSETGSQELSPHNYYDLYVVNIKTMIAKKIWELSPPKDNFVVANSMIVDTLNKCFYALCFPQQLYNTALFLGKFSMEKPEYEILANNIPFAFQDTYSYCDLFLDKEANELSAITFSPVIADSSAVVSIYSLSYPPLTETDLYQKTDSKGFKPQFIYPLIALLTGCIFIGILLFVYKKKNAAPNIPATTPSAPNKAEDAIVIKPVNKRDKKQAVFLLGGFQIKDKTGRDITGDFSPLLEQLFLILLLNTLKEDSKGISSSKLKDILWFDKSLESARNNRGVMLSKIRQIFEQVGFINIESQNSYWTIEFGEDIYCDYLEALVVMKQLKENRSQTAKDIKKFLSIVSTGELLPNLQTEWVDPFKADFANELIDLLLDIANQNSSSLSTQDRIDLADAIFIHDSLNEDALKLKCSALVKMGKNGLAKAVYFSFIKEYSLLFGAKFKYSFEQIITE